jgi:uncharacterized cupredoxin-like copper-binding protein
MAEGRHRQNEVTVVSLTSDQTHVERNPVQEKAAPPSGRGWRGPLNWFGAVFGTIVLIGASFLWATDGSDPAVEVVEPAANEPPAAEDVHADADVEQADGDVAAEMPVDGHDETPAEDADEPAEQVVDAAGRAVIAIEMVDYAYSPDTIEIQAGVPVVFRFTNTGNFEHEAMVGDMHMQEEFEAAGDHDADDGHHGDLMAVVVHPGETADLEIFIDEPGTTYMACHIKGHYEKGQIATINVTA